MLRRMAAKDESPQCSKLSVTPIWVVLSISAISLRTCFSISVSGSIRVLFVIVGTGSALRLTLPFGVIGKLSSCIIAVGTMKATSFSDRKDFSSSVSMVTPASLGT